MNLPATWPRRASAVVLALVVACGAIACGDGSEAGPEPSAERTAADGSVVNDADVEFVVAMVPHHAQAIEMVTLTDGRSLAPEVKDLADRIRATQVDEVEQMTDWLVAWGEEVPETSLDHVNAGHGGEDHSHVAGDAPGMASAEEMADLAAAPDAEFAERWLTLMREHHRGAVAMAAAHAGEGVHPQVEELARAVARTQEAEIVEIERLLGE